jgi:hypothetical protein
MRQEWKKPPLPLRVNVAVLFAAVMRAVAKALRSSTCRGVVERIARRAGMKEVRQPKKDVRTKTNITEAHTPTYLWPGAV